MLMGLLLLASCQAYSNSEDQTIEMEELYKDLPFSMPKVERPVFPDYQVSICDFGAKSNGVTLNTEAINKAIKAVHDKGGGKVVIPEGLWLTGPIDLQSNVNLHAEEVYKRQTWTGSKDEKPRPGIIDTVGDTEGYPEVKSLKAWSDTDGDGIPDIWEEAYGLDPNNPDDAAQISTSVDPNGRYSNPVSYTHLNLFLYIKITESILLIIPHIIVSSYLMENIGFCQQHRQIRFLVRVI